MSNENFKAERISKSATITVNGNIETVFPLFGAFEERKWAMGWAPVLIYPSIEKIGEGTTFKTYPHSQDEKEFLWIISKYQPDNHLIQYHVSTLNRFWTITIKCNTIEEDKTRTEITYAFTGLNEMGNKINQHALDKMYQHNLANWQEAINYYLKYGKALQQ